MRTIIGLAGAKQSGKTTLAKFLEHECGFLHVSFAHPIRKFVADLCGTDIEGLELIKEVPQPNLGGRTPRHAMQTLGTEWGRDMIWQDLWTNRVKRLASETNQSVVISDVRFPNEIDVIHKTGGVVLEITRPDLVVNLDLHASETHDLAVDNHILNNFDTASEYKKSFSFDPNNLCLKAGGGSFYLPRLV